MTCPTCHRAMVEKPLFFSVGLVCEPCERGELVPDEDGYVVLDTSLFDTMVAGGILLLLVFKERRLADSANVHGGFVQRCRFTQPPTWRTTMLKAEHVATCRLWMGELGKLFAVQQEGL